MRHQRIRVGAHARGGDYRISLSGLLSSLSGTYRLDEDIHALDKRNADLTDEAVQAAIDE